MALAVSEPGFFALIPQLLRLLENGQFGVAADLLVPRYSPDSQPDRGAFLSVQCRDNLPTANRSVPAGFRYGPILARALQGRLDSFVAECAAWNVASAPPWLRLPVISGTPILLLHGDLDFTTPLADARRATTFLPNSQLVVFLGRGHGVYVLQPDDPCVLALRNQFLDAPGRRVDTSCVG